MRQGTPLPSTCPRICACHFPGREAKVLVYQRSKCPAPPSGSPLVMPTAQGEDVGQPEVLRSTRKKFRIDGEFGIPAYTDLFKHV